MPEKPIANVDTNGRPIAEKVPTKLEQAPRPQVREPEIEDPFRVYKELMTATTRFYYDELARNTREGLEIAKHAQHASEDMLSVWRRAYIEGVDIWQGYWRDATKLFPALPVFPGPR